VEISGEAHLPTNLTKYHLFNDPRHEEDGKKTRLPYSIPIMIFIVIALRHENC